MSGLVWASNITLPVYAVGDGLFMQRVLNAIAALSNSGVLASLGLLGFMLGLLLMAMRAMQSGGRDVELPSIITSLIIYALMFGGTCKVMVQDMGGAIGKYNGGTYVVANVPFGVAAMGWLVSNVSYELSEKLEQAYSVPGATDDDVMQVGFNRTLDWLTAIRFAQMPGIDSADHTLSRYKADVVAYLAECTSKASIMEPSRLTTMRSTPDPLNTTDGIGFDSSWDYVQFYDLAPNSTAPPTNITCASAIAKIADYTSSHLGQSLSSAVAVPNQIRGARSASTQMADAWATAGGSMTQAQQFYGALMINDALRTAMASVPYANGQQISNSLMVDSANSQRASSFAGQESLFRSIMRPLMAFFESLVYIAAPFMVMAVGLGAWGVKMIGRYALATVWVSMWMPTLAAINMYQQTMVDEVLAPFMNPLNGSFDATHHPLSSMVGAQLAFGQLDNLIAAGGLLAASTPAITAFLLFASVQALNGTFSAAQGAGFLNSKLSSPDPVSTPALTTREASGNVNPATGYTAAGAVAPPNLTLTNGRTLSSAEANAASDTLSSQYQRSFGAAVSSALNSTFAQTGGVSSASSKAFADAVDHVQSAAKAAHVTLGTQQIASALLGEALNVADSAGFSLGATVGHTAGGSGGKLGINMGSTAGDSHSTSRTSANNTTRGRTEDTGTSDMRAVRAAIQDGQMSLLQYAAQHGNSQASALTHNAAYARMTSQLASANRTYTDTGALASGISSTQQLDSKAAANALASYYGGWGQATAAMTAMALEAGVSADWIKTAQQNQRGAGGMDSQHGDLVGVLVAMANGNAPGSAAAIAGLPPAQREAALRDQHLTAQTSMGKLVGALTNAGAVNMDVSGAMGVNPSRGNIGADAHNAVGTKGDVLRHHPGVDERGVTGTVHQAMGLSPAALAAQAAMDGHMTNEANQALSGGARASQMDGGNGSLNDRAFNRLHADDLGAMKAKIDNAGIETMHAISVKTTENLREGSYEPPTTESLLKKAAMFNPFD